MIRNTGVCLADIFKWLCHRTMLTALRGAYRFTPAQAAIFIAARRPVFHTGQRQHVSTAGSLRLRSAKHCFRSSPPPCRMTMRRGSSLQARYARASGGQRYFQHASVTEPFKSVFLSEGFPYFLQKYLGSRGKDLIFFPDDAPAVGNKDCCFPKCRPVRLW